jgi:hypothetical protein
LRVDRGSSGEAGDDAGSFALGLNGDFAVRDGNGTFRADLTGCHPKRAVLEDEILNRCQLSLCWKYTTPTARRFTNPKSKTMMPDPMTRRHMGRPRDFWLVASLFRFPRMLFPRIIMQDPKKLKPCAGESSGQTRAK